MTGLRSAWTVIALSVLVVCAGCLGQFGQQETDIGHEGGYNATDSVSVTTNDGLNATEREAVISRTMARIEVIRGLEFTAAVPVRIISRAEYRNQSSGPGPDGGRGYSAWNNQVWEALFLVDEPTNVSTVLSNVYGGAVLGYYANGEIVIVSDSKTPRLDPITLAHELTHALQEQQLSIGDGATTQDAQLAENGLIEGDATYVEGQYTRRCGTEWRCLSRPPPSTGSTPPPSERGVHMTIIMPYVEGPAFVDALYGRGGWEAVNAAYEQFPNSTEQIIHPSTYPDERPVSVTVENRSSEEWHRFDLDQQADTVGEGSIYTMFWMNDIIDHSSHQQYNYSHPLSAGWAGDTLVPYRNGDRHGYVWKTEWDTKRDADQFAAAYRRLLEGKGAHRTGIVFVIPADNPYNDAFRVIRDGRTVTIVNAPTVEELDEIHETT